MIPNMYKNMANLPGLQETYDKAYHSFRQESGFSSAEQEVVLLTISIENSCNFCTAAHSYLAENISKTPKAVIEAIKIEERDSGSQIKSFTRFYEDHE